MADAGTPSTAPSGRERRDDLLDAWRAVLILAVVAFHYTVMWTAPNSPGMDLYHYTHVYSPMFELGRLGVQVFFIVSGYVITMTLERTRTAGEFAMRRFSRLFPGYFACSLLTLIVVRLIGPHELWATPMVWLRGLVKPLVSLGPGYVDGAYWSLGPEVRFYLLIGIVYFTMKRRFWIGLAGIAALSIVISIFAPKAAASILDGEFMPYFLIGVAAWLGFVEGRRGPAALLGVLAVVGLAQRLNAFTILHEFSPAYLGVFAATTLALLGSMAWRPDINLGPIAYLGRISYGFYLLHQNIGVTVIGILRDHHWPDVLAMLGGLVVTIALASAMFHLVERPVQAWLRSLGRRPKAAVQAT